MVITHELMLVCVLSTGWKIRDSITSLLHSIVIVRIKAMSTIILQNTEYLQFTIGVHQCNSCDFQRSLGLW